VTPPSEDDLLPGTEAELPRSTPPISGNEPPPASLTKVVARGVGLAGLGYALSQLLTLLAYIVLAKLADPADFGHFAAGTVVVGVGFVLGESGLLGALIQRRTDVEEALNSAFLATLAGGVVMTMLALATAPLIGLFFKNHEDEAVAAVMAGCMFLRVTAVVPDALLQRRFSFMRRVVIDPLSSVAFAAGAIPAAASGLGVWALVIGTYASILVTVISAWAFVSWRPRPRQATVHMWRELARFGRPVMGANLIRHIVGELPVLALGRFSGASVLGQFTYASKTAAQPLGAVINAGGYVLQPALARLSHDDERFRAALRRSLRWLCTIAFPAGLLLVPLGTPLVVLVFGPEWREAGNGAAALGVYCAALSLDSLASEAWKSYGRPDMLPRMHGTSLVLTVVFIGVLLPFGLLGVTIAMSLSAVGVAAYAVRGMSRALGIPLKDLVSEIWPATVAAIVMAATLFPLEHLVVHAETHGRVIGLTLLCLQGLLGIAISLAVLAVVAPQSTREFMQAVRAAIRSRFLNRRPDQGNTL
jgi:O-antigen/teichoic acid export membrane protein